MLLRHEIIIVVNPTAFYYFIFSKFETVLGWELLELIKLCLWGNVQKSLKLFG